MQGGSCPFDRPKPSLVLGPLVRPVLKMARYATNAAGRVYMTGRQQHQKQQAPLSQAVEQALPTLRTLDAINPSRGPVWCADQGAIVELLNGKRSVRLPEVVS